METVLSVLGGLILFLFAVNSLSEVLQKVLGARAEFWMSKFTSNLFFSMLTGLVATTLLDSSSAVIILSIVLVNAGVLNFKRSMGIVLGANVGTTISSQIIAMDIGKYSPILLLIGFIFILIAKSERVGNWGRIILFFGVLFFGLFTMEHAVEPLREQAGFMNWMQRAENPYYGTLIGAVVTLIIQSSSATIGMAIVLGKKGFLTTIGGIAIMIGAELGTCSDTLLATIGGSRQAIKTGLFHLIFNVLSIAIGLLLFGPFVQLVEQLSLGASTEHKIANAHLLFNLSGVFIFVWFIPWFEIALEKIVPEKKWK